jgi:hypothetical protein
VADRDELERAFRRLTLEQRAVFVLHHYVGLPLVEVAAACAAAVEHVAAWMRRTLARLAAVPPFALPARPAAAYLAVARLAAAPSLGARGPPPRSP